MYYMWINGPFALIYSVLVNSKRQARLDKSHFSTWVLSVKSRVSLMEWAEMVLYSSSDLQFYLASLALHHINSQQPSIISSS